MLRPARLSVAIASILMLSGCMFFETRGDREIRKQPNFRLGYDDGCASANKQGTNIRHGDMVRDDALYEADKAYRVGWANGHSACMRSLPAGQDQNPLQDVHPGSGH